MDQKPNGDRISPRESNELPQHACIFCQKSGTTCERCVVNRILDDPYYGKAKNPPLPEALDDLPNRDEKTTWKAYEWSFESLVRFCEENYSLEGKQRVLDAVSQVRPTMKSKARRLDEKSIELVEDNMDEIIQEYDKLAASVTTPFVLLRATGEIIRASSSFAELVEIPRNELEVGWRFHELITEESFVNFAEKTGPLKFNATAEPPAALYSNCILVAGGLNRYLLRKDRRDDDERFFIPCSMAIKVRKDKFNLPSLVIVTLIPTIP